MIGIKATDKKMLPSLLYLSANHAKLNPTKNCAVEFTAVIMRVFFNAV